MPKKHQWFKLAAALALLVAHTPAAKAYIVPPPSGTVEELDCVDSEKFNADSRDPPAIIASSFSGEGARLVFRTCEDFGGNMHYYVRAPRPNRNGVCRAVEEEIFPAAPADRIRIPVTYSSTGHYITITGWTRSIPQNWVALHYATRIREYGFGSESACPFGDDPRYAYLANVSDNLLKLFQSGWARIASSRQSLESAIANLPAEYVAIEQFNTPDRQQKLRERVIQTVLDGKERPVEYWCEKGNKCFASFDSFTIGFAPVQGGIVLTKVLQNWRV